MSKHLDLKVSTLCFLLLLLASHTRAFAGTPNKKLLAMHSSAAKKVSSNLNNKDGNGTKEAAVKLTWEMLEDISYQTKQYKNYGNVEFPTVSDKIRRLVGKQIQLSGFVIPISMDEYALSQNMMASCFFCGEGGPESIAEINFKGKTPQLNTDQNITIQGKFRINETDPDEWIYFIDEAVLVKK